MKTLLLVVNFLLFTTACQNANVTVTGLKSFFHAKSAPTNFQLSSGNAILNPSTNNPNNYSLRAQIKPLQTVIYNPTSNNPNNYSLMAGVVK